MKSFFLTLAMGFALSGMGSALPLEGTDSQDSGFLAFLSKRAIASPDNTCGNVFEGANNSFSCDATANTGGCCSAYGYCGNTTDYCGTGCQTAFGTCSGATVQPSDDSFLCGASNGGLSCTGGLCCSTSGYCGNTTDYCDVGCQPTYGVCTVGASEPATEETCGPNFGGASCGGDQCCSVSGYCGNTQDYCADPGSCSLGYGRCDSDATPAGLSTLDAARPLIGPITYTDDIYDCVQTKVVALTYDDGPSSYTSDLLDVLKSYGYQATFFITGNNNGKGEIDITAPYPSLIQRMIAEGHQVASHTWSHYSLSNVSHDLRMQQMVKNEMAFNNIIGKWPTYMRPPYSDCTEASGCWADMQTLGYHRVYFDLDTQDYLNPLPSQIQNSKNIVQKALALTNVDDYLSIQHDIVQQSVGNLSSYYFDQIKAKGWKGVTVGECLGDTDRTNWYRSLNTTPASTTPSSTAVSSQSTSGSASVKASSSSASSGTTSLSSVKPSTSSVITPTSSAKASSTFEQSTSVAVATPTNPSTPAATCAVSAGNWCGKIPPFTDMLTCQKSAAACYSDTLKCATTAGWKNLKTCGTFATICEKLTLYCLKCAKSGCSNTALGY
ncbi:chitin binding protein [Sclerotinia borealis F-4128]|uniref:Chitin binding protein n=1 Tax=Sclerotinia borealis (strain F-4128) TaxID=1432307 RepID=W9CJK8_SCLBF|nr:chitin binding protein [Sclerotinia borealis F-4128]